MRSRRLTSLVENLRTELEAVAPPVRGGKTADRRHIEAALRAAGNARRAVDLMPAGKSQDLLMGCIEVVERWASGRATLTQLRAATKTAYLVQRAAPSKLEELTAGSVAAAASLPQNQNNITFWEAQAKHYADQAEMNKTKRGFE